MSAFVFSIWILATKIISCVKRTFQFESCKGHFNNKLHISLYMSIKTKQSNVRTIISNKNHYSSTVTFNALATSNYQLMHTV